MKMDAGYYEDLRRTISALDTPTRREQYRKGDFPRAELVEDLDKRYRWDLFWEAEFDLRIRQDIFLPSGLKNDHIDTALRKIVAPLRSEQS